MPSFSLEKCVQGSFSQSHPKFGGTANIQCACNALLVAGWSKVRKVSCWGSFELDHVLDLDENLFQN